MKKRKLIVVGGVIIVVAGLLIGGYFIMQKDKKENTPKAPVSKAKTELEAQLKTVDAGLLKEKQRIEALADKVKTVEDLKKIEGLDQGFVGIVLIRENLTSNPKLAKEYVDHMMLRNDSAGLEASVFCYKLTTADKAAQAACVARANEQARTQGIIGPNDALPANYFEETPKNMEQG